MAATTVCFHQELLPRAVARMGDLYIFNVEKAGGEGHGFVALADTGRVPASSYTLKRKECVIANRRSISEPHCTTILEDQAQTPRQLTISPPAQTSPVR